MALSSERGDSDQMLEKKIQCQGGQVLEQGAQGAGGVTIPGGVEELSGSGAEQRFSSLGLQGQFWVDS